jgi:DNA-binding PadR family transcriptional regulator
MPRELRLTPVFFHILLSLAERPRHGYALMQEVEERTGGRIRPGPGSLYYALARLEDAALICEAEDVGGGCSPDAALHEERRRYYALSPEGRRRLVDELAVLSEIVSRAGLVGLTP